MIFKNLAFAIRNVRRNKLLATINILGLSIGTTACLVIFLIASDEMGYDRFQPDRDRNFQNLSHVLRGYLLQSVPDGECCETDPLKSLRYE